MRLTFIVLGLIASAMVGCGDERAAIESNAAAESKGIYLAGQVPARWDKQAAVATHGLGEAYLSDYGFFVGELKDLEPGRGVVPYAVNAPLFSDYAGKARFAYFPEGTAATYHPIETFAFPEGAVLIKNFHYDTPAGERYFVETRLLKRTAKGWQPLSYLWDQEQTDARFTVLGATVPVEFVGPDGTITELDYAVPDLNQCKNCHAWNGATRPIGPTARQLNGTYNYAEGGNNQLAYWTAHDLLAGAPAEDAWPHLPNYAELDDTELAARAYLDANCGHCHRPEGAAKTSGLDLTADNQDPYSLGIGKPPVAAGKASGNLRHGIVPGDPDRSILVYRMASAEVGVAMPELGRQLVDERGVALISEWISGMGSR